VIQCAPDEARNSYAASSRFNITYRRTEPFQCIVEACRTHDRSIEHIGCWASSNEATLSGFGAVIRVHDEAGNVVETHEHVGDFKEP